MRYVFLLFSVLFAANMILWASTGDWPRSALSFSLATICFVASEKWERVRALLDT